MGGQSLMKDLIEASSPDRYAGALARGTEQRNKETAQTARKKKVKYTLGPNPAGWKGQVAKALTNTTKEVLRSSGAASKEPTTYKGRAKRLAASTIYPRMTALLEAYAGQRPLSVGQHMKRQAAPAVDWLKKDVRYPPEGQGGGSHYGSHTPAGSKTMAKILGSPVARATGSLLKRGATKVGHKVASAAGGTGAELASTFGLDVLARGAQAVKHKYQGEVEKNIAKDRETLTDPMKTSASKWKSAEDRIKAHADAKAKKAAQPAKSGWRQQFTGAFRKGMGLGAGERNPLAASTIYPRMAKLLETVTLSTQNPSVAQARTITGKEKMRKQMTQITRKSPQTRIGSVGGGRDYGVKV